MTFSFEWGGVTIHRSKNEDGDGYYFLDRFGKKVYQQKNPIDVMNVALRLIKEKVKFYKENHWVEFN